MGPDVLYALFTVFTLTYGIQVLGYERSQVLTAVLIGSAFQLFMIPLAGAVSDRINRRLVYGIAAVVGAVWTFVFFGILGGNNQPMLIIGIVLGLMAHSFMYGPQAAFIVEQFSPAAPLHRQLTGLHLRRSDRRRHRPADVHPPAVPVRHLDSCGHLRGRRRRRDPDRAVPGPKLQHHAKMRTTAAPRRFLQPTPGSRRRRQCQQLAAEQDVPGNSQMMFNRLLRFRGVAGHQGIQDALVFGADVVAAAGGTEQRGDSHQDLPDVKLAVGPGDQLVARGVDELLMEQRVQPNELPDGLGLEGVRQGSLKGQGLLHLSGRHLPSAMTSPAAWRSRTPRSSISSETSRPVHQRHVGAALGDELHQAVGDQQQQRLADRGAGDADVGREFLFVEELSLHVRVDQNVLTQIRVGLFPA